MSYWIFLTMEDESVFKKRIANKSWPISKRAKYQSHITIGDNIIFYQGGMGRQRFLGTAEIKSPPKNIPEKIDHYVDIENIEILPTPLGIRNLLPKLELIKNQDYWGLYIQGDIVKLNKNDYLLILKEFSKLMKQKIKQNI